MRLRGRDWILLALCAVAGLSCGSDKAVNPPPADLSVEAEDFTAYHDVEGSVAIQQQTCSTASGRKVVAGLDEDGEWIEIPLSVPETGLYDVTIRYSAPEGLEIVLKMSSEDCGGEQQPEFTLNEGEWVG